MALATEPLGDVWGSAEALMGHGNDRPTRITRGASRAA